MRTLLWTLPLRDREVSRTADSFGLTLAPVRLFTPAAVSVKELPTDWQAQYGAVVVGSPASVPVLRWLHPRVGAPLVFALGHATSSVQHAGLPTQEVDGDVESIAEAATRAGVNRLIWLRGPRSLDRPAQYLRQQGIQLDQVQAYRMLPAEDAAIPTQFDGVVFGSGAAVDAFFSLPEATPAFELPCFAAGTEAAATLREFGIPTIVQAPSRAPAVVLRLAAQYFKDSKPFQA